MCPRSPVPNMRSNGALTAAPTRTAQLSRFYLLDNGKTIGFPCFPLFFHCPVSKIDKVAPSGLAPLLGLRWTSYSVRMTLGTFPSRSPDEFSKLENKLCFFFRIFWKKNEPFQYFSPKLHFQDFRHFFTEKKIENVLKKYIIFRFFKNTILDPKHTQIWSPNSFWASRTSLLKSPGRS